MKRYSGRRLGRGRFGNFNPVQWFVKVPGLSQVWELLRLYRFIGLLSYLTGRSWQCQGFIIWIWFCFLLRKRATSACLINQIWLSFSFKVWISLQHLGMGWVVGISLLFHVCSVCNGMDHFRLLVLLSDVYFLCATIKHFSLTQVFGAFQG